MLRRLLACLGFALVFFTLAAPAAAAPSDVQTTWRLLDYVAVDYAGAVRGGKVISASEYAEMREFSGSVLRRCRGVTADVGEIELEAEARAFKSLVERKARFRAGRDRCPLARRAPPCRLSCAARAQQAPDLGRGARLFQETCASCHGAKGDAQTAMARQLDPPPIAFSDRSRAKDRSPFALYQVINQGLEGTAMQSFAQLPDADKWALAYQASRFAYPDDLARQGKSIWQSDAAVRSAIPTSMR